MKCLPYIVAALVVWAIVQVIVLNVCVSLINARITALDTKVELHATVTRLIDERSNENRQRIEKLEQADKGSPAGDTFPESNDPAECK